VNAENHPGSLIDSRGELDNNPELAGVQWFQRDDVRPRFGVDVRAYPDDAFGDWVGRRGTVEWPARSPDTTPLDFSLCGVLKCKVFATSIRNIAHLKTRDVKRNLKFNAQIRNSFVTAAVPCLVVANTALMKGVFNLNTKCDFSEHTKTLLCKINNFFFMLAYSFCTIYKSVNRACRSCIIIFLFFYLDELNDIILLRATVLFEEL